LSFVAVGRQTQNGEEG